MDFFRFTSQDVGLIRGYVSEPERRQARFQAGVGVRLYDGSGRLIINKRNALFHPVYSADSPYLHEGE